MLKILSLRDFDAPSFDESATVAFIENNLHYCDYQNLQDELQPFSRYLRKYPEVSIASDILATRETSRTVCADDLFLPVHDSIFKRLASIWREKGVAEVICLTASAEPEEVTTALHWIATRLKWALDLMEKGIYHREILPTSGSGSVVDVVQTRDWEISLIRCIAWHPHCARLAVVTRDDRIRIFSQGIKVVPILRHSAQKSVCCISWRPLAGKELAVACHAGVLVWTIEVGASSSLSHAVLLKQRNHVPVTHVTWHPQGDLLVSCSPADTSMMIWDTSRKEGVPLRRVGGGGLCFTRWSSCGSRLFSATCRNIFRVWNTGVATAWHADKWTVPNGRVAVACFGPNLTLLFASNEDPATIFSLPLQENIFDVKKPSLDDVKIAVPVIDLTKVNFACDDDYVTVGGRIIAMEWDPTGRYLAILFQTSPWIAVIKTKIGNLSRIVDVQPGCLIKGYCGELPTCIHFYQECQRDSNVVCLTIAWSSGRIQHFPIVEKENIPITDTSIYCNVRFL
ncbi:AAAS [Anthophora quadrimaculata]